ncbi:hypothetical protein WCT65_03620 [Pectobacterium carotovorum]|uniref:hypothetical protein n=1 Tax=Pectobacterium carotovorum TaxID=554 RepID=UPI003016C32C
MSRERRNRIKPSDVIATFALIISLVATFFAYTANKRAEKLDNDAAAVAIQSIGGSIRALATHSRMSYLLLNGLNEHIEGHPEDNREARRVRLATLMDDDTPKLPISLDSIMLISRSDVDAANKIEKCRRLYLSLKSDLEGYANASVETLSTEQSIAINIIPYRFFKVSEACDDADKSLAKYLIDDEPVKGTIGEMEAAQILEHERKNDKNAEKVTFSFGAKASQP